jgi:hypothetical protein
LAYLPLVFSLFVQLSSVALLDAYLLFVICVLFVTCSLFCYVFVACSSLVAYLFPTCSLFLDAFLWGHYLEKTYCLTPQAVSGAAVPASVAAAAGAAALAVCSLSRMTLLATTVNTAGAALTDGPGVALGVAALLTSAVKSITCGKVVVLG